MEGLDERYFMYGEDIDLSYQFIKAGFQNYYLGSEKMIHFKGESTLRDEIYFKRFFDSIKLFFKKHYSNSSLLIRIISVFFYVAKHFKKTDMAKKERTEIDFNSIYFYSENVASKDKLKSLFNQNVQLLNLKECGQEVTFNKDLIIFDTSVLLFQDIINFMVEHRSEDNLFRFTVPQPNVLIGSDSSTSQAKVDFF
jgi:hypothetical protein